MTPKGQDSLSRIRPSRPPQKSKHSKPLSRRRVSLLSHSQGLRFYCNVKSLRFNKCITQPAKISSQNDSVVNTRHSFHSHDLYSCRATFIPRAHVKIINLLYIVWRITSNSNTFIELWNIRQTGILVFAYITWRRRKLWCGWFDEKQLGHSLKLPNLYRSIITCRGK